MAWIHFTVLHGSEKCLPLLGCSTISTKCFVGYVNLEPTPIIRDHRLDFGVI